MASATALILSLTAVVFMVCAAAFFALKRATRIATMAMTTHIRLPNPTRLICKSGRAQRRRGSLSMKLSRASSGRGRAHSATKPLGDSKADGDHGDAQASPQRVFLKLFSGCVIRCSRVRFDEFEFAGLIRASGKCRGDGFAQLAHCFPDEWIFECEQSVPGT